MLKILCNALTSLPVDIHILEMHYLDIAIGHQCFPELHLSIIPTGCTFRTIWVHLNLFVFLHANDFHSHVSSKCFTNFRQLSRDINVDFIHNQYSNLWVHSKLYEIKVLLVANGTWDVDIPDWLTVIKQLPHYKWLDMTYLIPLHY